MDFTKIKDKKEIYNKLDSVNRQVGLYGGKFFEPFQVDNFLFIVSCIIEEQNNSSFPKWTPQQLFKLKKITSYNKVKVKILENKISESATIKKSNFPTITNSVHVNTDIRFKNAPWKNLFNNSCDAIISPDLLVDIIRYCQIINNLKLFI